MTLKNPLPIPDGDFKAYLFDCDGTVADSMPLHYIAWRRALAEWNCDFSEDIFYAWGGRPIVEIITALNDRHQLQMPVAEVAVRKEQLYYDLLPRLTPVAEVLHYVETALGKLPMSVVSGSTRESVTASLNALGLRESFDALVCAGEYARSKPHPDPFLKAAELLRVPPQHCLVFEDTDMGIDAAKAAGMAYVKVPLPHERGIVIEDLIA